MNSLVIFVFAGFLAYTGSACTCAFPSQEKAWNHADIVTKMNVVEKKTNGTQLVYMANYLDIFKPQNQSHIFIPVPVLTQTTSAACGAIDLVVGKDYLIAATYDENKRMNINSCSGMPADREIVSKPPGALDWEYVSPSLLKKLQTGDF